MKLLMESWRKFLTEISVFEKDAAVNTILDKMGKKLEAKVFYPRQEFCTDNGAMIALAGHLRLIKGQVSAGSEIVVKPRWSLEELEAV